jgi:predicted small integral membrane protein
MKAYVIAILVVIALISVALTTVSGHIQKQNNNFSEQTCINQPDITPVDTATLPSSSDSMIGTTYVSFGVVAREVITTALLFIGSIVVLKKKK